MKLIGIPLLRIAFLLSNGVLLLLAVFLGWLLTSAPVFTERNWRIYTAVRLFFTLGPALALTLFLWFFSKISVTRRFIAPAFLLLGLVLAYRPLVDFTRGPRTIEGVLEKSDFTIQTLPATHRSKSFDLARHYLEVRLPDASLYKVEMEAADWQWLEVEAENCLNKTVRIKTLPMLSRILSWECGRGE